MTRPEPAERLSARAHAIGGGPSRYGASSARGSTGAREFRVALIGPFGRGNHGADAALESMIASLGTLRPDARLVIVCDRPPDFASRAARTTVPMAWLPAAGSAARLINSGLFNLPRLAITAGRALKHLSRIDLAIVPGTHLFDDYPPDSRAPPWALALWLLTARALGVRTALVSVGAGPFRSAERRWARLITADAGYRSCRDGISRESMATAGIDVSHDPICPDLMFALRERKPVSPRFLEGAAVTVGVDVVSRDSWPDEEHTYGPYIESLATFVHWLLDRGLTVRLLPGDTRGSGVFAELAGSISRRRFGQACERLSSTPAATPGELMELIQQSDIVAASHYHVAVGALRLGKPTLSLGLSGASEALLAEMGFRDFYQPAATLDADRLIDQFTRLAVDRKAYELSILEVKADIARRLAEQEADLAELLRDWS